MSHCNALCRHVFFLLLSSHFFFFFHFPRFPPHPPPPPYSPPPTFSYCSFFQFLRFSHFLTCSFPIHFSSPPFVVLRASDGRVRAAAAVRQRVGQGCPDNKGRNISRSPAEVNGEPRAMIGIHGGGIPIQCRLNSFTALYSAG